MLYLSKVARHKIWAGCHSLLGGVTFPLGGNDWGVISTYRGRTERQGVIDVYDNGPQVKLVALTEQDDIELYLITFERIGMPTRSQRNNGPTTWLHNLPGGPSKPLPLFPRMNPAPTMV